LISFIFTLPLYNSVVGAVGESISAGIVHPAAFKRLYFTGIPVVLPTPKHENLKGAFAMPNDLFGNLGGLGDLLGGLAKNVIPKDTPEGKVMAAQAEMSDLQKQEEALLVEIGRLAYQQNPSAWPQDAKLKLIQMNIASAKNSLNAAQQAREQAETAKNAVAAQGQCPGCGHKNPEGVKFCQECGTALKAAGPKHCSSCGAELAPGTRFCGECGAKQGEA
jgi:hypothetical protein